MSDPQTQDLLALLAVLVARSGGNVKVKFSELNKLNGRQVTITPANGFVRIKIGSAA